MKLAIVMGFPLSPTLSPAPRVGEGERRARRPLAARRSPVFTPPAPAPPSSAHCLKVSTATAPSSTSTAPSTASMPPSSTAQAPEFISEAPSSTSAASSSAAEAPSSISTVPSLDDGDVAMDTGGAGAVEEGVASVDGTLKVVEDAMEADPHAPEAVDGGVEVVSPAAAVVDGGMGAVDGASEVDTAREFVTEARPHPGPLPQEREQRPPRWSYLARWIVVRPVRPSWRRAAPADSPLPGGEGPGVRANLRT